VVYNLDNDENLNLSPLVVNIPPHGECWEEGTAAMP